MLDPPVKSDAPVESDPIALAPATFSRFEAAARYVEGLIRTRAPRASNQRFPGLKPGAWGLVAAGDTISAGSGLTLGSGKVTLCAQDGAILKDTGVSVTVYNSGPEVSGGAYGYGDGSIVRLAWTEGAWAVNCWGGAGAYS